LFYCPVAQLSANWRLEEYPYRYQCLFLDQFTFTFYFLQTFFGERNKKNISVKYTFAGFGNIFSWNFTPGCP